MLTLALELPVTVLEILQMQSPPMPAPCASLELEQVSSHSAHTYRCLSASLAAVSYSMGAHMHAPGKRKRLSSRIEF